MDDITTNRVTISGGATVFLEELTRAFRAARCTASLRMWSCGGAAVPPETIYAADEQGIPSFRIYGMTELPTVTLANGRYPLEKRAETDGPVAPGVEVQVVDEHKRGVAPGIEGELLVRGPERMLGYVDHGANEESLLPGGWFRTGDLGTMDVDGYLIVTGRVKDIINRGGEKISAQEIENILTAHPAVAQTAVVAAPHERFGEVPAAFVVTRSGGDEPRAHELTQFLRARGLPKQKCPEQWFFVDALPMTTSGKVMKDQLLSRLSGVGQPIATKRGRG
jgi:acyl-CoA synthetase